MTNPSVDQPVRWGVLGTALIATKVGKAIRNAAGAELAAIASRDLGRAQAWGRQHGATRAYGSYDELLDAPDIDAVYIPLPPSMHAEWTIKAAEHGKHVLCEKPLAINLAEARTMAEACRRHNVQFMDGVMWVHHDRTPVMHGLIQGGALGEVRRVTSAFCFNGKDMKADNLRLVRELGGGVLGDLGWYCTRVTLWAFGDLPQRVYATGRYVRDVDVNFSALLWFSGGRMASFDCGFDMHMRKWFEVAGTEGSLVCDDFVLPASEQESRFWVHADQQSAATHSVGACVQEVRMIEHFSQAVRSGQLEPHWVEETLATQRVCDALDQSARSGRMIDL